MRKKRAEETKRFAQAKQLNSGDWKGKLMRLGERLFGHKKSVFVPASKRNEEVVLKDVEAQPYYTGSRKDGELDNIIDAYDYSIRSPGSEYSRYYRRQPHNESARESMSSQSIYSQVTGVRSNNMPQPRQPVKENPLISRFSVTTSGTKSSDRQEQLPVLPPLIASSRPPTPAEEYKAAVRLKPDLFGHERQLLAPEDTGFSQQSRNLFVNNLI